MGHMIYGVLQMGGGGKAMSERYKAFIRELKARLLETDTTPAAAAEFLRVSVTTMYNWLNLRTVMDGENMLLVIDLLMGGRYGRRTA